jgi:hypothetical protein
MPLKHQNKILKNRLELKPITGSSLLAYIQLGWFVFVKIIKKVNHHTKTINIIFGE